MVKTPCPTCQAPLVVRGARATCGACGQAVRFVDAPEVACTGCGKRLPLRPGHDAVSCSACCAWTAAQPGRRVEGRATCPRCRRRIEVPLTASQATCPHCAASLALQDTL